jgi:hypothetical protein
MEEWIKENDARDKFSYDKLQEILQISQHTPSKTIIKIKYKRKH